MNHKNHYTSNYSENFFLIQHHVTYFIKDSTNIKKHNQTAVVEKNKTGY